MPPGFTEITGGTSDMEESFMGISKQALRILIADESRLIFNEDIPAE